MRHFFSRATLRHLSLAGLLAGPLALATVVVTTGCERDAGDHMEEAADDATDAAESVGDAAEQGLDDLGDEFNNN